jgi:TatD DNase family protein
LIIDAHAHLDLYAVAGEAELNAALSEIAVKKIFTISNSIGLVSYKRNLEICRGSRLILPIFGVHPWYAAQVVDQLDELEEAVKESPMLGEIGLDYALVPDQSQFPAQRKVFEFFLTEAHQQNKIVHLHMPGAEADALKLLRQHKITRGVVHWYSGPLDILHELAGEGFYFTVGVEALKSEHIVEIARQIPLERLLTETDGPDGPRSVIGRPGTPGLVVEVLQKLAEIRGFSPQQMESLVEQNLARLFSNDPHLVEAQTWLTGSYS